MSEIYSSHSVEQENLPTAEVLFAELLTLEPKAITNFVPTNGEEQKEQFLSGEIRNPDHRYEKLQAIDFDANRTRIQQVGAQIVNDPALNPKYVSVYESFTQNYLNKTTYLEKVNEYKLVDDAEQKAQLRKELMKLNIELFGEPDETVYRSVLAEKIDAISAKDLSGDAAKIRDELKELVGDVDLVRVERFRPSDATVNWMNRVAHSLYDGMLSHLPDQEKFEETDIKAVFDAILVEEFGDSVDGWTVDIEKAQSINLKVAERRVVIPEGRNVGQSEMRELIVHEIGIHLLRSIMGEQTDLEPLRLGLSEYYDGEEGLGVVMEQAINGEFVEAGLGHYITAGLAHFDGKDFRDIFEIKWRLAALEKETINVSESQLEKTKIAAYKNTMRIMRGTDDMPWFKDLAYYNGAAGVWKQLEAISGDDVEFTFVLLGKANAANPAHKQILLETATPSDDDGATEEVAGKV